MKLSIKKISIISFIFLLNVSSFAALVSDNDDTAFVTKFEFDSFKKNLENEIDKYNSAIDSRTMTAIEAYLAEIKVSQEPDNLWKKVMSSTSDKFLWCSGNLPTTTNRGTQDTDLKDNIAVNVLRYYNHPEWNVYGTVRSHSSRGQDPATVMSAGVIYAIGWRPNTEHDVDPGYHIERAYTSGGGTNLSQLTSWTNQYDWARKNTYATDKDLNNQWVTTKQESIGNGKLFELNKLPNDNYELKTYYTKAYFDDYIDIKAYKYKNGRAPQNLSQFNAIYTVTGGMNDSSETSVTFAKGTGYTGAEYGNKNNVNYEATSAWSYGIQTLGWITESDGIDYSFRYWGTNTNQTLYTITDNVSPNWSSSTTYTGYGNGTSSSDYYVYQRDYYPYTGPHSEDVKVGNVKYTFYHPQINPETFVLSGVQNSYISKIAKEEVFHGQGAPAFYIYDKEAKYKLKDIEMELYDSNGQLTSGEVKIMLSNNKFNNGNYNEASDKIWEKTVTVDSTGKKKFTSDEFGVGNVNTIWINVYPTDTSANKMVKLVNIKPIVAID